MSARRFQFLGALLGLVAATAVIGVGSSDSAVDGKVSAQGATAPAERPNILLVVTDDQRDDKDTMHVMDFARRFFKRNGVRHPNAFVTTPQCCPSRASIFSGRYTHNHHTRSNKQAKSFNMDNTWVRGLDQAGYHTGLFGKFLNGWTTKPDYFDRFAYKPKGAKASTDTPFRRDRKLTGHAIEFIDQVKADTANPWAVTLSIKAPHVPFRVQRKYRDAKVGKFAASPATREQDFSDKNPALARAQFDNPQGLSTRKKQLRMLMSADDQIKRLISTLRDSGELQNTLVIFVSDNGYHWGEHGLRGKFLPYLNTVKVPMNIRWVGNESVHPDSVDRRFALNIDVGPTILDAAGVPPSYTDDGRSLLDKAWERPWILLEGAPDSRHDEWPKWDDAYYDGKFHYIRWANGFREKYDLRRDPYQTRNRLHPNRNRKAQRAARTTGNFFEDKLDEASTCQGPTQCP